jgi:hypothetical protein
LILNKFYKTPANIILCGDFNVNFLDPSWKAFVLESLLCTFALEGTVKSPTRVTSYSKNQIDNIFLNNKYFKASTYVLVNAISDHEGQLLTLPDLTTTSLLTSSFYKRVIDDHSVQKFVMALSYECWGEYFLMIMA